MREIKGIDVSGYNPINDYQAVKNDGVEFAVLKIMRKDCHVDKGFKTHLSGFRSVGVRVSDVYTYSYATTVALAQLYAKHVVMLLKEYGMPKTTVVWLDIEDKCQMGLRGLLIDIINTYYDIITAEGYPCGLYTGMSFYNSFIKPYASKIKIPLSSSWIARYYKSHGAMLISETPNAKYKPFTPSKIAGWQYTSTGTVKGCVKPIDLDLIYVDDGTEPIKSKVDPTTLEAYVNTNGGRLNVRNSKGAIVGKLNNKEKVTVYAHADGKFKIGTDRYVADRYVTVKGII